MNRGNRKSDIFKDEEDFQVYLTILRQAMEKYEYTLYSYCLMTNYIYMQIETKDIKIWEIKRYINLSYTKYFNNKYNFIGNLFQERYRAEIIESDAYNLQTSRYIHLNPVKAAMVEMPVEYKWSSYIKISRFALSQGYQVSPYFYRINFDSDSSANTGQVNHYN